MMGVYIKGMEMPTRCAECWLMDGEDSWCTACRGRHLYPEYRYGIKDRPEWCPLVPVPPHGRLIDADELAATCDEPHWCAWLSDIDDAPTIIPAELPKEEAPTGPYDLLYEEGGPDA